MLSNQLYPLMVELLQSNEEGKVIRSFLQIIKKISHQNDPIFLQPDVEGKHLKALSLNRDRDQRSGDLVFNTFNFKHPFSHAIQNGKRMEISQFELILWRDSKEFIQFSDVYELTKDLVITPLFSKQSSPQLLGLLLLVSDEKILETKRETLQFINDVFAIKLHQEKVFQQRKYESKFLERKLNSHSIKEKNIENRRLVEKLLVGESNEIKKLIDTVLSISSTSINIFVYGETGTGKELVAKSIHQASDRKKQPFIAINCSAIPENLIESELFGIKKGAFTGADQDRVGLIEKANGGVLFLDEIGDMPYEVQAKLLRVLETKEYRPVGSNEVYRSDFRLVSATNIDINKRVEEGEFRADLFYRINQYRIVLPPLKERREDILILTDYFINEINTRKELGIEGLTDDAERYLLSLNYDGNVRELKSLVETAAMMGGQGVISKTLLQEIYHNSALGSTLIDKGINTHEYSEKTVAITPFQLNFTLDYKNLPQFLDYVECEIITTILNQTNGNRKETAALLGIPLRTLAYKCQKHKIMLSVN